MADYLVIVPTDDGLGWRALPADSADRVVVNNLQASSTLVAPSNTAFPPTPATGEILWRTDEQKLYRYNGSTWEAVKGDADGVAEALGGITGNPHGFLNQTDTTISFVNGTRTFTLAPAGVDFTYYFQGRRVVKSSAENIVIPDISGVHFVYYDNTDTLQTSTTPWSLELHVPVVTVTWNSVLAKSCLGEERHTVQMDWRTHKYLHRTNGTRYVSGLTVSGYVINSDTDADVTIGVSDGYIYDEDIEINPRNAAVPTQRFEQLLADPAQLPVCYRQTSTGTWYQDNPTTFYFNNGVGGLINYNQWTGSQWQQTEATNGYHVAYWIFATNSVQHPIVSIMGQRQDNNLPDALDNNSLANMDWGTFPFQESRILFRIILQTGSSFGGTRKVKVQNVTDYRNTGSLPTGTFVPIDHSSLGGLTTSGHPANVIETDTTNFDKILSVADTTAQLALETIDEHNHGLKSSTVLSAAFAGNPRKATVTFASAYPDSNYSINLTPVAVISNGAFVLSVESKTSAGFVINANTNNISNLISVDWSTVPFGE